MKTIAPKFLSRVRPAFLALATLGVVAARSGAQTAPAVQSLSKQQISSMVDSAWELESRAEQSKSKPDWQAAADAMEKALMASPDALTLRRTLGWIYLDKLSNPKKAYAHLDIAYMQDPNDTSWGLELAKAADAAGMTDREIDVLNEVIRRDPNDAETYAQLAAALDHAGRTADAEKAYESADRNAVDEEWVLLAHAHFLHSHGRDVDAERIAKAVLAKDPKSVDALGLLGDIHRGNWDLTEAREEYAKAMEFDPTFDTAKSGLSNIETNAVVQFSSDYYLFFGSDGFHQMGWFNTLSVPVSDHVAIDAMYNNNYFANNKMSFGPVVRFQEDLGVEYHVNSEWAFRGGVDAFQQPGRQVTGFNVGATWKPTDKLWIDATYRLNDPVNDTMYTVAKDLSQDVAGVSGGYQFTDYIAANFVYTYAEYNDGNSRQFLHLEPYYVLYYPWNVRIGGAYEMTQYGENTAYSSRADFQTVGPILRAEPVITPGLTLPMSVYPLYVISPADFGVELSIGPTLHIGSRLQLSVSYSYYYLPGSSVPYSGNGLSAGLTYRF